MDIAPDEFPSLQRSLAASWRLGDDSGALQDVEALLEALAERVARLIQHDFQRLLNAMYLLDVSEERFNQALDHLDPMTRARRLAEIILEREIEKARSRELYRRRRDDQNAKHEAPGRLGPGADDGEYPGSATRVPAPDA